MIDEGNEGFRLSPSQSRIWRLSQHAPSDVYRSRCAVLVRGELDPAALRRALAASVERYEILRTTFHRRPEMSLPVQVIAGAGDLAWSVEPAPPDADPEDKAALAERLLAELGATLDAEKGPVLAARISRTAKEEWMVALTAPSLSADGASLRLLVEEALATAWGDPGAPADEDEILQYADVAEWQHQLLESQETAGGRDYWQRLASHRKDAGSLPYEKRPSAPSRFSPRRFEAVASVSELRPPADGDGSLAAVLLSAWRVLLGRLTGQPRTIVGVAFNGRRQAELHRSVGPFRHFLPLPATLEPGQTFQSLVASAREAIEESRQWQEYFSWETWNGDLDLGAEPPYLPFCFELQETKGAAAGGSRLIPVAVSSEVDRFKIKLTASWKPSGIELAFDYDPTYYSAEDMSCLDGQLAALLARFTVDPEFPIGQASISGRDERHRLLTVLSRGGEAPGGNWRHRTGHRIFEEVAERFPSRPAVACEGRTWTYEELNRRANQLAHRLRKLGVGPESPVLLGLDRSPQMLAGMLGTWKAGGAYAVLEPETPPMRLRAMTAGFEEPLLVVDRGDRRGEWSRALGLTRVLDVSDAAEGLEREPEHDPAGPEMPAALAYVVFTSGSSGSPKGVMVEHRQLLSYVEAVWRRLDLSDRAGFATVSTFAADLGNTAVFPALLHGGCLHVIPQETAADPEAMAEYVAGHGVDVLKIVPSHLAALLASSAARRVLPRQRLVLGGEAGSWELVDQVLALEPGCRVLNHYGPSETTVGVSTFELDPDAPRRSASLPLGRPLAHLEAYPLDGALEPVAIGLAGECHVAGAGLSRGYLGSGGATAARFVPHPFAGEPGARLYRTGDRTRHLPDGTLEFLGRTDSQLKIRGVRIEPGEIESLSRRHPAVRDAVVQAVDAPAGGKVLAAYLVPDPLQAAPVRRMLEMSAGVARQIATQELPNGGAVFHLNANETEFLYQEIFERRTYLKHGVRLEPGSVVFDVGANIGLFSLFAGCVAKDAVVYAFEPVPRAFQVLELNAKLHGFNIEASPWGLAQRPARASFTYYPHVSMLSSRYADEAQEREVVRAFLRRQPQFEEMSDRLLDELLAERLGSESVECELKTLSQVMRECRVERIDLLKIDVQKSELDVLQGIADEDWPKIRQIVVEVHDVDSRRRRVESLLAERGFEVAVEQEEALSGTRLYDLYAVRPGRAPRSSSPAEAAWGARWASPARWLDDVRDFLAERLPEPMMPSAFVALASLPLTSNGKLDRRALPEPVLADDTAPMRAPRDPTEERLQAIWGELLGRDRVSVNANFFRLGGHSLLATRLISRVRTEFSVDLPLRGVFDQPTIEAMAAWIRQARAAETPAREDSIQPLTRASFSRRRSSLNASP